MKRQSTLFKPPFSTTMILLVAVGMFLTFGTGCNLLQRYPKPQQDAINLYQEAWSLINDNYYDPSHNHQEWKRWAHKYDQKMHSPEDAYQAIETMVASLNDPYTLLLPPKAAKEQSMHISSKLFGVGIQIAEKNGKKLVISPIEDSPAAKANIKPLDEIVKVNAEDIRHLAIDQVVEKIRGPKGTKVTLTLKRGNHFISKPLVRDEIQIKSVSQKSLGHGLGYIQLSTFISEQAEREMSNALMKAQKEYPKGIIIDLRGNSGGLLNNALSMADMLLNKGTIVSVVGPDNKEYPLNAEQGVLYDKPVAVLIDGGSASASEIFSGALQDNHRALLVGSQSFGKGLVQRINTLRDGSNLNITISRYLTPSGKDIHHHGITPDIKVKDLTASQYYSGVDPVVEKAKVALVNNLLAKTKQRDED